MPMSDSSETDSTSRSSSSERSQAPLLTAAENGDEKAVKHLLEANANIEIEKDGDGKTPLFLAAQNGHEGVVKLLLDRDANIETSDDSYGQTPLWWAARNGHEEIVQLLLDKGAFTETCDFERRRTPLSWAAQKGYEEIVEMLLEHNADIETEDVRCRTPLLLAAQKGRRGIVKMLLKKHADVETRDIEVGQTPLAWAAQNGRSKVVKLLLDHKADIETKDDEIGKTPLALAAQSGHKRLEYNTTKSSVLSEAIRQHNYDSKIFNYLIGSHLWMQHTAKGKLHKRGILDIPLLCKSHLQRTQIKSSEIRQHKRRAQAGIRLDNSANRGCRNDLDVAHTGSTVDSLEIKQTTRNGERSAADSYSEIGQFGITRDQECGEFIRADDVGLEEKIGGAGVNDGLERAFNGLFGTNLVCIDSNRPPSLLTVISVNTSPGNRTLNQALIEISKIQMRVCLEVQISDKKGLLELILYAVEECLLLDRLDGVVFAESHAHDARGAESGESSGVVDDGLDGFHAADGHNVLENVAAALDIAFGFGVAISVDDVEGVAIEIFGGVTLVWVVEGDICREE
ncbi:Ankyrin repeat domain-containing protein 17 [Talaromyces pinophilus]|nr:Ankyrin repeat domain-containing protein 17 [Talaromyces pinophilus]